MHKVITYITLDSTHSSCLSENLYVDCSEIQAV